jgi:hypothetical protein
MGWDESEIFAARRAILQAVEEMLAGTLSYIDGARKIHTSRWAAKIGEHDADLSPFEGIISETDALPTEETRMFWQAAALGRLQPEIDRLEAWSKSFGEPHCHSLVARFCSGQIRLEPPL